MSATVCGIPAALAAELQPLLGVDCTGHPVELHSAIGRPGSWEYQTPGAKAVRDRLQEAGWWPHVDPSASWRRVWRPSEW